MKDNFSTQAKAYSKFRPTYPDEMINYILSFVSGNEAALDVATGNGQIACKLSPHFKEIYATDISEKQLENAIAGNNIHYSKQQAESMTFSDKSFNLIVVAQAIHWFNFDAFYKEVHRLLKPTGIFAVIGYGNLITNPESQEIITDFYENITGPYWDPERKYLDENYETIPFPFDEIPAKKFTNEFEWTFEQLIGYLGTWSAVQHYRDKKSSDPIELIHDELKKVWETTDKKVTFPLLLRIGKLKT